MKYKRSIALLLSLVLLMGCIGITPAQAAEETTNQSQQSQEVPAPEHVDQDTSTQVEHVERMHAEEGDDLNKLVFRNTDGSRTMYIYDHPVKYRDEQGQTHDISLEIADTEDSAYPFRTKANSVVTAFPTSLSNGITLSGNGVTLRLAAQIPAGNTALNHNARRVDEETIAYTYDAKTTIEYALTYTGFKEDIVVSEYTGQTEYPFILYTNGLNLTNIDGSYYLTDNAGTVQASIGDVIVFTADERNNTFGTLQATTIKPGQIYGLTIVLDADYLADPNTAYPIRIDPTVELVYTDANPNAIEEKTLQSNNTTSGSNAATVIGVSSKGISRTIMKFPGLDFSTLSGALVTSAVVTLRDLMCESEPMTITCYPFTGGAWTESSTQWAGLTQSWGTALDSNVVSYSNGVQQTVAHRYRFDITVLAQRWINGTADEDLGIIFRSPDAVENGSEIFYKTFATSERASYKPTFEITYQYGSSAVSGDWNVDVGSTIALTTNFTNNQIVTWRSDDNSIATVSDNGVVTGVKVGTTTITATPLGGGTSVTFTVYVTVADGLYYIKNAASGLYLQDYTNSARTFAKKTGQAERIPQLWKITYINYGNYSIRPIEDLSRALYVTPAGSVCTDDAAIADGNINSLARWQIRQTAYGYAFLQGGLTSKTMTPIGTTANSLVNAKAWSASAIAHWELEEAKGIFLRDTTTLQIITPSTNKIIELGQTYALEDMDLSYEYFGVLAGNPTWNSTNSSIAYFDESDEITPLYGGEVNITLTANIDGISYSTSFPLTVIFPLSGYELNYEPDIWNSVYVDSSHLVRNYTNCYAYILNCQVDPAGTGFGCNSTYSIMGFHKQQPGDFYNAHRGSNPEISCSNTDPQSIIDAVEKDFEAYNAYFGTSLQFYQLTNPYSPCPEGSYRVALVIASGIDYHWYRQDSDGYWSHKLGESEVERFDHQGNLILDPRIADRGEYTDYIAFFIVTPWNNLYSSSASSLTSETEESTSLRVSNKQSISSSIISRLYIGMSISDALQLIGFAGTDIGNGTIMHVYETSNSGTIKIVYKLDESGVYRISSILEDIV